ncbi:damage-control phosphatase ARMT1 family protein [Streptacidiphilus rugosus]|uniref:damage-control phosphatase ARMT1 family protein n=1 Tax=Streptacidiphilus rugosus TaxID=405783 RepID=UPI0005665890|nr:damage-control phosphatase ARMT1 family protein [Streptacidiphilus rugosus]
MTDQAPAIISTDSPFATDVFVKRHPALIERILGAWPLGPEQHHALRKLAEENVSGFMEPLPASAPDADQWRAWGRDYYGKPWTAAPFLWAESFFYRRLLNAVGYFGEGVWQGLDLFAPFKQAELAGEVVAAEVEALDDVADLAKDDRGQALLLSSLWGNRADLSFQIQAGRSSENSGLVADDSDQLWKLLEAARGGTLAIVADNAGSELIADLALIDHLLTAGTVGEVVLYVKPAPYYVSDAMVADVGDCLRKLLTVDGAARGVGERLREAAANERLHVRTDPFFCAPFDFTAMPDNLRAQLASASATILKGDLNYRRLVGDRWWDPTVPFGEVTSYFPGAVAALRTLKSDVAVGLEPGTLAALEASGTTWRTAGTHALIQVS